MFQALGKRGKFGQSQHGEVNLSINTIANAFKSDFHGWLGVGLITSFSSVSHFNFLF